MPPLITSRSGWLLELLTELIKCTTGETDLSCHIIDKVNWIQCTFRSPGREHLAPGNSGARSHVPLPVGIPAKSYKNAVQECLFHVANVLL